MFALFNKAALITSDAVEDGDSLLIPALLSVAGHYPDKNITLSTADFDNAVQTFQPVSLNYEHKNGPLDNRLGQLRTIWREGERLFGQVSVPKWLDFALRYGGERPKLSAEFNLLTKRLTGLAWTANPRVQEAGLVAAFTSAVGRGTASYAGNSVATFAKAEPPAIYYNDMALHQDDVDKLIAHWNLDKDFPNVQERYRELQQTLNCLTESLQGKNIVNRIVGRGGKKQ